MARIKAADRLTEITTDAERTKLLSATPSVLQQRPEPPAKQAGRSREWEKNHPNPVSFRNFPHDLRDQLVEIAKEHGVRVGEVARRFTEYGLNAFESGEIDLDARLEDGRLTLYPGE